jgi:hypothetical protein
MNADKYEFAAEKERQKSRNIAGNRDSEKLRISAGPFQKSPLRPPFLKGSCEKIQWREAKAFLVVRGRGKFTPPKPGGRRRTVKHFPDFRRATPATWEYLYKKKDSLFGSGKLNTRPATEKPAPVLAA